MPVVELLAALEQVAAASPLFSKRRLVNDAVWVRDGYLVLVPEAPELKALSHPFSSARVQCA